MKVELEVLASCNIKRKKPWPRLAFLGESQERLFLLDAQRLSELHVPSGKTKKKIPKLSNLLPNVLVMNHSHNGHYLAGLLQSGDVFLWHKDTDMLKTIPGVPDLAMLAEVAASSPDLPRSQLFISDDASKLLVVLSHNLIYVWDLSPRARVLQPRQSQLPGTWSQVLPDKDTLLPDVICKETDVHAMFFVDKSFGQCCACSAVFNDGGQLCVTTLHLRWFEQQDVYSHRSPLYTAEWTTYKQSLGSIVQYAQPIRSRGAYLARHSQDGRLLAAAVNQQTSHMNRVLFYSPTADTVVVADLKGCGAKRPIAEEYRQYWLADMQWTCDNLFVVCITKQGTVCLLTRLGEPLLIQTHGCSIEMGPKPFLPLHPLIMVRSTEQAAMQAEGNLTASMIEEQDLMRQRFSIATHPGYPMAICSDGYMVTILHLPVESSCLSIMKTLVIESNGLLRRIRDKEKMSMTLFDSLRRQGKLQPKYDRNTGRMVQRLGLLSLGGNSMKARTQRVSFGFQSEDPPEDFMNASMDSDFGDYQQNSPMRDLDGGQIVFGDVDNLNQTADFHEMLDEEKDLAMAECIQQAQKALMLAWGLAASHSGLWMVAHEELTNNIGHNMVRLFTAVLHCPIGVIKELNTLTGTKYRKLTRSKKSRHLSKVLHIFKTMLHLLNLDAISKHLMVCAMNFIHSTADLLLHNKDLKQHEPRTQTLHGVYKLLKYCDSAMSRVYSTVHKGVQLSAIPYEPQIHYTDIHEAAVLVKLGWSKQSNDSAVVQPAGSRVPSGSDGDVMMTPGSDIKLTTRSKQVDSQLVHTPLSEVKRLTPTWKLLYRQTLAHYNLVLTSGGGAEKLDKVTRQELRATLRIMVLVQCKLHALHQDIPVRKLLKIHQAEKLCIEGCPTPSMQAWSRQLKTLSEDKVYSRRGTRALHAILYSLLLQDQLRSAVELIEFLLRQNKVAKAAALCRADSETKMRLMCLLQQPTQLSEVTSTDPVAFVTSSAVRYVLRSMARLMASYFSNRAMFVYPPHSPYKLPSLLADTCVENRIMPLYHDSVTSILRREDLSGVWTPERTLHYLLLGGLLTEAVWFVNTLGDWKAAFLLAVACEEHARLASEAYSNGKVKRLPADLKPESLLRHKLQPMIRQEQAQKKKAVLVTEDSNFEQLTKTLSDLLLAATICHIDITPWLLEGLVAQLKVVGSKFAGLVPEGLYLPAPPVYCPQPPITDPESLSQEVLEEVTLRQEASSVIQLAILVLNSSRTTLPAARWYIHKAVEAFAKGLKFQKDKRNADEIIIDIQVLQEAYLPVSSSFQGQENDPSIHKLLVCFRELCCLLWMLYARDKLSLTLRQKHALLQKKASRQKVRDAELQLLCQDALQWALHMLPFSRYLDAEYELYGTALSQLVELPANENTAKCVIDYFYDFESLHPEIQEKLKVLQKEWQGVFLDKGKSQTPGGSPRGMTLSVYFQRQARKMEDILRRKGKTFGHYEQFVFDSTSGSNSEAPPPAYVQNGIMFVGSRPCESMEDYLKFLDMFYAVSFSRIVDAEKESPCGPEMPLLLQFSSEIRARELNSLPHKAITSLQKRQSLQENIIQSPRSPRQPPAAPTLKKQKSSEKNKLPPSPRRKVGLFRSQSLTDVSSGKTQVHQSSMTAIRGRSSSELNLSNLSIEDFENQEPFHSKPPSKAQKVKLERSTSVASGEKSREGSSGPSKADPLASLLLQVALLENMDFGKKYRELEQLLEWLTRWADRNHSIAIAADQRFHTSRPVPKASIKMKMVPRIIIYSLWQVEHNSGVETLKKTSPVADPRDGGRESTKKKKKQMKKQNAADNIGSLPRDDSHNISITGLDNEDLNISAPSSVVKLKGENKHKKKKKKKKTEMLAVEGDVLQKQEQRARQGASSGLGASSGFQVAEPQVLAEGTTAMAPHDGGLQDHSLQKEPTNSESSLNISSLVEEEIKRAGLVETLGTQGTMKLDDLQETKAGKKKKKKPAKQLGSKDWSQPAEHTDASMNTSVRYSTSDGHSQGPLVDELRHVVRKELRVMMEAQHQGILAMLGALEADKKPEDNPLVTAQDQTKAAPKNGQECIVLTAMSDVHPHLDKPRSRSSTDVDITPLPSDELTAADHPLSVGELARNPYGSRMRHPSGGHNLPGLLHELKLLEHQQTAPNTGGPPPQGTRYYQQGLAPDTNKENMNAGAFGPGYFSNFAPQDYPTAGQPFGRVMGMLKHFNTQTQGLTPREEPVHFPKLAWTDGGSRQAPPMTHHDPTGRMPLLQIDNNYGPPPQMFAPPYSSGPLPPPYGQQPAGASSTPGGAPFPLLYMPESKGTLSLFNDPHGTPRLVPPEILIQYEQKRMETSQLKKQQAFSIAQQVAAQRGYGPDPRQGNLLDAEVKPFGPWHDVDNAKRQKRRQKKAEGKQLTKLDDETASEEPSDVTVIKVKAASPRKSPRKGGEKEGVEEETPLNHGYALTPGLFDEYLQQQDSATGPAADTTAKLQYNAAMAVQPKKKKDAAVETDPFMDKSTSITRDTATDPVTEAIEKYYRAKTGKSASLVAPDVFLGLRFGDASGQPATATGDNASDDAASNGRAFLNVVDINSDMLDEITSTVREREALRKSQIGTEGSPAKQHTTTGSTSPLRHVRLEAEREDAAATSAARRQGPDTVTADLLGKPVDERFAMPSADNLARGSRYKTRESIRRRLEGMNDQFDAIAAMTRNMEEEFKNTNLLMHTIDQVGEALVPERDPDYPESKVLQRFAPSDADKEGDVYTDMDPLKPSQVKQFNKDDKKAQSPRKDTTQPERTGADGEGENLHVSGLSGISDILEEVLGQGKGHDLTQTQADELVEKALMSSREGVRLSNEELKEIFDKKSPRVYPHRQQRRTEEERAELLAWMEKKRAERQKANKQRDTLKSSGTGRQNAANRTFTQKELQSAEELRNTKKREQEQETYARRMQLASQLMGEILTDQPTLPSGQQRQTTPTKAKTSARTSTQVIKGSMTRKVAPRRSDVSPARPRPRVEHSFDADHTHVRAEDYMYIQDSYDFDQYEPEPVAYQEDQYVPREEVGDTRKTQQQQEVATPRAYKPKPYTELVKLQRPEATRSRPQHPKPKPYVERLSQMSNAGSATSTPKSAKAQQRLYGTSRLPGTYKAKERKAPRLVKTYSERLQDMKHNRPPSQPVSPRRRTITLNEARQPPARQQRMVQRKPHKPRKTQTYAEQLQKLQPPKEMYRTGQGTVVVRPASGRRSAEGPPHKPKTYVEQLQELQVPPTVRHRDAYGPVERRYYQVAPPHSRGPYPDPYSELDDLSEVSPWSMDQDVQKIIYDGDTATTSYLPGTSVAGTETDIGNISELEQLAGLDYTEMVDVSQLEQIVDGISVGSGSVMSVIDWDQVDMLIGDVK